MPDRSIHDLESQGSFLTRVGPVGRALSNPLSFARRKPARDAAGVELLPRDLQSDDASHCMSGSSYDSGRINSLARRPSDRSDSA